MAALFAVAQANVHEFYAEHQFMCSACETSVGFVIAGGAMADFEVCKDATGATFTSVCPTVEANEKLVLELQAEGLNVGQICERLKLCDEWVPDKEFERSVWNPEIVNFINADDSIPWEAEIPVRFEGLTLSQIQRELGAIVDPEHRYEAPAVEYPNAEPAPTDFDSRMQWPYCVDLIGHVRDQSSCGSCWAFGSTEAFNDRVCITNITSQEPFAQLLSVEDTTACCSGASCGFSNGCNGGQPTAAWQWFQTAGCPSGGDYGDKGKTDTCEPYTLPPCAHHVTNASYTPCPTTEYHTPRCTSACSNTYSKSWSADKHHSTGSYSLRSVNAIMSDLVSYGSVSAGFTVYEDFLSYKSGVYVHKSGRALGGHAIKIFGYGVMNGQSYWYCANSWNDSWGNNGFFKILKGVNECGIEGGVGAGHPKN